MPRTPPKLRSRVKRDKGVHVLSVTTSPSTSSTAMPTDTVALDIETVIRKTLNSDDILDKLVNKLVDKLKDAVVNALSERLQKSEEEIAEIKEEVTTLKSKLSQLDKKLNLKNDDLEQYTRRNNIRIFGIPEVQGEDTDILVTNLFKDKLNLNIPVEKLDRSHRVGRPIATSDDGNQRWRPIIVRFASYRDRRNVFNAKRLLKGTNTTIREDLTAFRVEVLREAANRYGHRKTWTVDGKIFWLNENNKRCMALHMEDLPR